MIIPAILSQKYENYRAVVRLAADEAKKTLQNYCDKTGYAFASRIKTVESLAEKIETGRHKNGSDLDDLYACTIIVPTLSKEELLKKVLYLTLLLRITVAIYLKNCSRYIPNFRQ
jgi:hypothetical protein